jgi:hypothetical protein
LEKLELPDVPFMVFVDAICCGWFCESAISKKSLLETA